MSIEDGIRELAREEAKDIVENIDVTRMVKEVIAEEVDLEQMVKDAVDTDQLAEDLDLASRVKDAVDDIDFKAKVMDAFTPDELADELDVQSKIEAALEEYDIEQKVKEGIEEYDLTDKITDALDGYDFDEVIGNALDGRSDVADAMKDQLEDFLGTMPQHRCALGQAFTRAVRQVIEEVTQDKLEEVAATGVKNLPDDHYVVILTNRHGVHLPPQVVGPMSYDEANTLASQHATRSPLVRLVEDPTLGTTDALG